VEEKVTRSCRVSQEKTPFARLARAGDQTNENDSEQYSQTVALARGREKVARRSQSQKKCSWNVLRRQKAPDLAGCEWENTRVHGSQRKVKMA